MATFIGIDLGTTYSAVAAIDETGRPYIVHNKDGVNITPSCVHFADEGKVEVGEEARKILFLESDTTLGRFKRDMGTSASWEICGTTVTPSSLSALVLKKLAADPEASVGAIGEAVVTIPANFSHEARQATLEAAKNAGLNIKYIINEPTAAALYYAFKSGETLSGIYTVYDLGGGTFDVSIIRVNGQDVEVLATNGVSKLGGDDFDGMILKLVQDKFKAKTGEDLEAEDFTKNDAEQEKKSLSKRDKVTIRVARQLIEITREEFEESISALISQAEMLCEATIEEAEIEVGDIQGVLLVGGSTRIPTVTESVKRVFEQEPLSSVNVDEVVALGAALYAAYKGDKSQLSQVQKTAIQKIRVGESTSKCFGTIAVMDNQVTNQEKLMNSLLIRKGDKIPCSVTESFFTVYEGQESVSCKVTESTAPETDPRFVKVIWEGDLDLPAKRAAGQEIKITFSYDDNQIMKCSFIDVSSKREKSINLSMASSGADNKSGIDKFMVD